jgi:hypothetical protein
METPTVTIITPWSPIPNPWFKGAKDILRVRNATSVTQYNKEGRVVYLPVARVQSVGLVVERTRLTQQW